MRRISFVLLCLLFSSAVSAQEAAVSGYLHDGPHRVRSPWMADSLDVNGKKFEIAKMLDGYGSASGSVKGTPLQTADTGELTLTAFPDGYTVGRLAFYVNSDRFTKAKLTVSGLEHKTVYLDGEKQSMKGNSADIVLEPGRHGAEIVYILDPGSENTLKTEIKWSGDALVSATTDAAKTYTIYDVIEGVRVRSTELSPDGRRLLVGYSDTRRGGGRVNFAELTDMKTGKTARLGNTDLKWMPRASLLWYVRQTPGRRDFVVVDPATFEERVLWEDIPEGSFRISPTEDFLIYTKTDVRREERKAVRQKLEPDDRGGWRNRSFLYKYDPATGVMQRLTFGHSSTSLGDISPDGTRILFSMGRVDFGERPLRVRSCFTMDLRDMSVDTLFLDMAGVERGVFSPDGNRILFSGSAEAFDRIGANLPEGAVPNGYDTQLFLYDLGTRAVTPLTREFDPSIMTFEWSVLDGLIYVTAEERDRQPLYTINPVSGTVTRIPLSEDMVYGVSLSKETPLLTYFGAGLSSTHRLFSFDLKKRRETLLKDISAEVLKDVELGEAGDWNFQSSGGDTIYGRYYLPVDFDPAKKYPMVVYYYGGTNPTSRRLEGSYSPFLYSAMGFVVYVPQPSGATGFGQEFSSRHVNAWGGQPVDEIIEGVGKFCDAHPFVDRAKIGCIGASYGGYTTQYLQTVTDIFAAAVSHAGISALSSYWGEGYSGYSYSATASAGSYPWNDPEMYAGKSPLFNADKINTPLLLLHGTADTNVPPGESHQMFLAMKILGKEVALVTVDGENHGIAGYDNRILWSKTIYAWFEKWLKDRPEWWDYLYPEDKELK